MLKFWGETLRNFGVGLINAEIEAILYQLGGEE